EESPPARDASDSSHCYQRNALCRKVKSDLREQRWQSERLGRALDKHTSPREYSADDFVGGARGIKAENVVGLRLVAGAVQPAVVGHGSGRELFDPCWLSFSPLSYQDQSFGVIDVDKCWAVCRDDNLHAGLSKVVNALC